jgi:hypothetical protein
MSAFFALGVLLGTSADAATFYLKTDGNDSVQCPAAMSPATPKRTITGALPCLTPGSTLLIGKGTYPTFKLVQLNGTPTAQITLRPLGDGKVTIDRAFLQAPTGGFQ